MGAVPALYGMAGSFGLWAFRAVCQTALLRPQAIRKEVEDREEVEAKRSSSKKKREGNVKVKPSKGGRDGARVEVKLDSKKYRRKDRRLLNQEAFTPEDEDYV